MTERNTYAIVAQLLGGGGDELDPLLGELAVRVAAGDVQISAAGALSGLSIDADTLDGEDGSAYHNATNLNAGTVPDARFPATLPAASGTNLTALNASALASGTVPDARFPATLPAASGANLTALNATNLASGTVPDARFPATLPAASGANLTALSASALASGTVPVARLGSGTHTVVASTATGAQNNWAPGLSGDTVIFWNGASALTVTGFAGGVSGQRVTVKNITAAQVATFSHASGSSDVANRLTNVATSAGTPIAAGGWITYEWDSTNWKLVAHEQGAWITPTFDAGHFTASTGNWTVDSADRITMAYRLTGRTITVAFVVNSTDVSATPSDLNISNSQWGGFTNTKAMRGHGDTTDAGGTIAASHIRAGAGGTAIAISKYSGNFSTTASDNTNVAGTLTCEVD